jgi:hypothetical protein
MATQRRPVAQPQLRTTVEVELFVLRPLAIGLAAQLGATLANIQGRGITPVFRGALALGITVDL